MGGDGCNRRSMPQSDGGNRCSLRHSSWSRSLRLSTKPLCIADPTLATQNRRAHARLMLFQSANDLRFAETAPLHRLSNRSENRRTSNRGLLRKAGHRAGRKPFKANSDAALKEGRSLSVNQWTATLLWLRRVGIRLTASFSIG